jgi:NAD(P)-dependent dehydrogenase (short-subunit alcohol dehydrogenase family)
MAQVWLVTGSSRGLGRAIVEAGLAAGNKVLATARDIKSLADLSERYGDQVKLFAMDVTDEAAAANAVMVAVDVFGSLDVVINNAWYGNLSSVEDTPLSEFRAQIETNLFGTIIVTKAALRYFREKKAGQFIQFSSVGGRIGPPGRGPIRRRSGVSKASPRCFRAKWHDSASRSPSLNPVAFAQTSRAVPPNFAKVILNTIRRLERPQDFSGTTTASSLVTPKRQLRRSCS